MAQVAVVPDVLLHTSGLLTSKDVRDSTISRDLAPKQLDSHIEKKEERSAENRWRSWFHCRSSLKFEWV